MKPTGLYTESSPTQREADRRTGAAPGRRPRYDFTLVCGEGCGPGAVLRARLWRVAWQEAAGLAVEVADPTAAALPRGRGCRAEFAVRVVRQGKRGDGGGWCGKGRCMGGGGLKAESHGGWYPGLT
jgi:hypothetical protein